MAATSINDDILRSNADWKIALTVHVPGTASHDKEQHRGDGAGLPPFEGLDSFELVLFDAQRRFEFPENNTRSTAGSLFLDLDVSRPLSLAAIFGSHTVAPANRGQWTEPKVP